MEGSVAASKENRGGEPGRSSKMPVLPVELIDLVFDQVILDAPISKDGTAVCALMYTSRFARARAMRVIEPASLQPVEFTPKRHVEDARYSWLVPFCAHFVEALNALLQGVAWDPAKAKKGPELPAYQDLVETESVSDPDVLEFGVYVHGSFATRNMIMGSSEQVERKQDAPLETRDVVPTFRKVLHNAVRSLRGLSPYMRAKSGIFEAGHLECEIQLAATHVSWDEESTLVRDWVVGPSADPSPAA